MQENLKILMIAPTAFFSSRGGHLRILGEVVALKGLGYSVTLCTYGMGNDVSNVRIFRGKLKPKNLRHGPSKLRALLDIDLLVTSIKRCVRERPDIVHCHLHEGAAIGEILSFFTGTPIVLDAQGSISEETIAAGLARRGSAFHFLLRVFEILTIRKAHVILVSSNQLVETYRSLLPPSQEPKLKIVLDGFDNSHFKPLPKNLDLQRELGIPENKKIIVYLGSLERQQGIMTMIETARHVLSRRSDVHFLFMGTPVDVTLDECKAVAAQNRVLKETTFLGTVPYEIAPEYLSLGDIAISGKISKTESNGKICVYMAMGLPTVCFDTPVNRDLLGNLGFFAEGPTPNSLAEQVLAALGSLENRGDALRNQLAKRANDVASWSSMASRISESYGQIVNNGTLDR